MIMKNFSLEIETQSSYAVQTRRVLKLKLQSFTFCSDIWKDDNWLWYFIEHLPVGIWNAMEV